MKRALVIAALAAASLFAFPVAARADHRRPRWGFDFGFGSHGPYFRGGFSTGGHHRQRHVHVRSPIYARVWVPPVYNSVVVGYDHCGRPIYRTVMVQCGHHETVITGYRCGGCGTHCD